MAELPEVRVYVSVGANMDPERNIIAGIECLAKRVSIVAVSSVYRTEPIGRPDQPAYLNGVIAIDTALPPKVLKNEVLRAVEAQRGRVRTVDAYAPRPLDLDILLYGDRVVDDGELEIPDPDITGRPFLAAGLLELDPSLRLPGDGQLLAERIDSGVIAALTKADAFTRALKERLHHES